MNGRTGKNARNSTAGDFEVRLRAQRAPRPPADLADRCMPSRHQSENLMGPRPALTRNNRLWIGGAGGLAAAAALALAVLWASPGGTEAALAAADALRAAHDSLERIDAVHIVLTACGPEVSQPAAEIWVVRDLGFRLETDGGVDVYNAVEGQRYMYDRTADQVQAARVVDPLSLSEILQRGRADRNVDALTVLATRDPSQIVDEWIQRDGRTIRRISAPDAAGQPMTVEIDPADNRVLLTRVWTLDTPEQPALQLETRFDYPEPDAVAAALFENPAPEGTPLTPVPDVSGVRMQCLINARNLVMALMIYSQEHDGLLPGSIEELAPYAAGGDLAQMTTVALPGGQTVHCRYLAPEQGLKLHTELTPRTRLFIFDLPGVEVVGYGDGHAETHDAP